MRFEFKDLYDCNFEIPDNIVLDYVQEKFHPENVFDDDELGKWADENGFVKED